MKVKELIEKLKEHPADMDVLVSGYEGGYDDLDSLSIIRYTRDTNDCSYCGDHDEVHDWDDDEKKEKSLVGLHLN